MTETAEPSARTYGKRRPSLFPLPSEERLVDALVQGETVANAYRIAYDRPTLDDKSAAERGSRVKNRPRVKALFDELMKEVEKKAQHKANVAKDIAADRAPKKIRERLLTLNDRLSVCAEIVCDKTSKKMEKLKAIEVYTKIAGGFAPTQMQVTGADGGPIQSESTVTASVTVMSVSEKLAIFRAKREAVQGQAN